jgi:hypothetical protein
MATKSTTKAAAETEAAEVETEAELTTKQVISEGIARVIEATGIDVQKNRYKAMRAIAFEAFAQAIEAGTFDDLVDSAIANVDELPSGWEIERVEKTEAPAKPATKKAAPAKAAATKAPAKAPAKSAAKPAAASPRKRPAR